MVTVTDWIRIQTVYLLKEKDGMCIGISLLQKMEHRFASGAKECGETCDKHGQSGEIH